jgi:DNA adenine methylase
MKLETLQPFLKWPGGKRWAISRLLPLVKAQLSGSYFEPFLGGGALFFALAPARAVLSDINDDLMNVYRVTRSAPDILLSRLKRIPVSKAQYEATKSQSGASDVDRAVRFLYLNRTCFGGIYRLNQSGQFNVPYGGGLRGPATLWRRGLLHDASSVLRNAVLNTCDFEESLDAAGRGDVVYCDPTYTVTHDNNGFIRYNESNFSWEDQERLSVAVKRANRRGSTVLLSNAHHSDVRSLFKAPTRWVLRRNSMVSADPTHRKQVAEYLFYWPGRSI